MTLSTKIVVAVDASCFSHLFCRYTTIQKFGVSKIFYLIKIIIQQRHIKDSQDIYNVTKKLILLYIQL